MKYKLTIEYEYITEEQEHYNELIDDEYLPDEAKRQIESDLRELADRISGRADNVFCGPYDEIIKVEEIEE